MGRVLSFVGPAVGGDMAKTSGRVFHKGTLRRHQLRWEFLRRNEEYQREYQEFSKDPQRYRQQEVYFPPVEEGETREDWRRRVEGRPHWAESRLSLFRRKWQINYPHDPNDPKGWSGVKEFREREVVAVIWPTDSSAGRAGPSPYLDLRVDLTQPVETILAFIKKQIRAARIDMDSPSYRHLKPEKRKTPSLNVLKDALQIYDLVKRTPEKPNWVDIARAWKPELRYVRLNRAREGIGHHQITAARERAKYLWRLAQQHIGEGGRLV